MKKQLIRNFAGVLILLFLSVSHTSAQHETDILGRWNYFKGSQNFLYNHLTSLAFEKLDMRKHSVGELQAVAEWQRRQHWIRQAMLDIVGPFPEKTPLNARVVRTIRKDSYRVEHILYESQPGFVVTSSLYIPAGLKRNDRAPVVIYCSGHSAPGYRSDVYQHVITNLVIKGFIVFAFDPVGQGERLEYFDAQAGKSLVGGPTAEHAYAGAQAFITGSSQAMYMIWDGIRAVDYLLTRKEVDPERIGITGRSGGGTQSAYIAAMDDRIYAAAPECYITNLTRLLQSIGPQDAEQNLYYGIHKGIDHPDYLTVRAPKPALVITTINDMFNIHGARETAREVSTAYKAFGKPENFGMTEDIAPHESTKKNREAMYAFFQKHLNNPGSSEDEDIELLTEEELRVSPTGQISVSPGSETVFSLNSNYAETLNEHLDLSRKNLKTHIPGVVESAKGLSGYTAPGEFIEPVYTGCIKNEEYITGKYFIQGEGDYIIPYLLYSPSAPSAKALIYLHPEGKKTDPDSLEEIEWFIRQGYTVLVPDLIGTGEAGTGDFHEKVTVGGLSYRLWYASILINKSITGIWAGDIVRLSRVLERDPSIAEISALAKGVTGPALLHAAAFNPAINKIALVGTLTSYNSLVMNKFYSPVHVHTTVAGALRSYDLPDLGASLAPRDLLITGMVDGADKTMDIQAANREFFVIRSAYADKNAENSLKITMKDDQIPLITIYREWTGK